MVEHAGGPETSRSWLKRGLIGVVASVAVNVVFVLAADAVGIAPRLDAVEVRPVAVLSTLGGLAAIGVYGGMQRWIDDHDRRFRQVALVGLLVSFVPDLALLQMDETATVAGVAVLMVMHVVSAAFMVGLLSGFSD